MFSKEGKNSGEKRDHGIQERQQWPKISLHVVLENLEGITSTIKSDHILNLFEEIEGNLPDDKERMTSVISSFLALPLHEQMLYQVGRRTGIFRRLTDLNDPAKRAHAEATCRRFQVTPENVDEAIDELMKQFI